MTSQFIQRCNYGALISGGFSICEGERKQASIGILHKIIFTIALVRFVIFTTTKIGCKNVYYLNA